jgi:hypothetical protein
MACQFQTVAALVANKFVRTGADKGATGVEIFRPGIQCVLW